MNTYKNIFNIRESTPFWDTLAQIYLKKYQQNKLALASCLFLVANRRACQLLTEAFIRLQSLTPTILPQIIPIADINDDELFFSGFSINQSELFNLHTISKEERLFLFTRLISSKPADFGLKQITPAQALSLASDLSTLIDTAYNQDLSFDRLQDLVPEKYATHWQETLKLLKIITEFWPKLLAEREAIDVVDLKNKLLFQQADLWTREKTDRNIIVAGVTANFSSIVSILKAVKDLQNGEIYFAGIDRFADEDYWQAVSEEHPQFELKELLSLLNIDRFEISDVIVPDNFLQQREHFISEVMRPAVISNFWQNLNGSPDHAVATQGIKILTCNSQRDEALAIALKMREVLTFPEKTVALITYDRNLARRVASELSRFNIKIDDSAGLPLNLSPIGIFLRLIAEAALDIHSDLALISLLKNPFTLLGNNAADFRKKAYQYETSCRRHTKNDLTSKEKELADTLIQILTPLSEYFSSTSVSFKDIFKLHICLAEKLASSADTAGKKLLWRGEAGKCAAQFSTKILETADTLGPIDGTQYLPLLCELMGMETVRAQYGTHPRLSILGPIEAKLSHFDYVILGEINEGIWPKPAHSDMWMSRPMKKDFGFSLPEKNTGILADDLCHFLAMPNILLTRAERIDGVPMKKSRWLLRLETVLKALGGDILSLQDPAFSDFVNHVDRPVTYTPISSPAPCPPLSARPRKLSASGIDLLLQDPYSVFAKYILNLYPFEDLDKALDARDYGTLIHAILEEFNTSHTGKLPENPLEILIDIGKKHFYRSQLSSEIKAFWWPSFERTANWIIKQETGYRDSIKSIYNEISGEMTYPLPHGNFTFTAKADRIDELTDGTLNIIDYKTGTPPNKKQINAFYALQLPIEALIAQKGGFSLIKSSMVNKMIYWQLGKSSSEILPENDDFLQKAENRLINLVEVFDSDKTPYLPRPFPKYVSKNKDYEHLSRIREWSVLEEGEDDD